MSDTPYSLGRRAGEELFELIRDNKLPVDEPMETGILPLDVITNGGLRRGEVSIVGAQTGHGKSALVEQISLEMSLRVPVSLFALEMKARATEVRLLAKIMRMDATSVKNLMRSNPQHERLQGAIRILAREHNLVIEDYQDGEDFTVDHVANMLDTTRPAVAIVDHMRHLSDWNGTGGTFVRSDLAAQRAVQRFVQLARFYHIHIMLIAQTKAKLIGKRPSGYDLADTTALAQNASLVVMIHRPFRGKRHQDTIAELIVDKNRYGPEGMVHTRWHGPTMTYRDLMPSEELELECCKSKTKQAKEN